ncbi:MAG: DUF6340 family protein [Paludibacter sp.]|nr:DUF6340 family protein [Paludibacter sp.]
MRCLKNIYRYVGILIAGVLLTSCSGMLYTSIDVLRPAKVSFPIDVNHLLIVNNTVPQPPAYGHKATLFNENQRTVVVETDSLAIFALASFSESVIEKEFFSLVDLVHESKNKGSDFFTVGSPDQGVLKSLADEYDAHAIIALNKILVHDDLGELYDQENNSFIAYLEAKYEYNWSIHFPLKNQMFSVITKDTVYWESESYGRQRALNGLPDRRDALIDGALISGRRVVNKFIPYWEKVDRYLFSLSDKTFKKGLDSVYVKEWDGAIKVWEGLLVTVRGQSKKAKIAHNLSVLYEIKGNIKQACDYSNQALEAFLNATIIDYRQLMFVAEQNEILKVRLDEINLLNKQLGEESEK